MTVSLRAISEALRRLGGHRENGGVLIQQYSPPQPPPAAPGPAFVPQPPSVPLGPAFVPPPKRSLEQLLLMLAGVVLGVAIFGGLLAYHVMFLIPPPPTQYTPPTTDAATITYRNTVRLLAGFSMGAMDFAVAFSVTLAWVLGFLKGDIPEGTRRGAFLFGTVFLAVWIIVSTYLVAILSSFIRYY